MLINYFYGILLGAVQGITEFLPISSTGHLILIEKLLGISQENFGLTFDALLHLGTLISLLWFFKKDWLNIITTPFRLKDKKNSQDLNLIKLLIVATIPGALFGLVLEKKVETVFRSPLLVGISLIVFSFVLVVVEKWSQKSKTIKDLKTKDAILTGFAQAVALIPGVSRSGITIAAGMWEGLTREQAAKFTFLISAPIIAGAGGKKLIDVILLSFRQQILIGELGFYLVGMLSAAIFGYLTIKYFLKFVSRNSLYPFIYYRILLGLLVIFIYIIKS